MDISAKEIWSGIVIGGAGGAIAGLTVSLVSCIHSRMLEEIHKHRIYTWLVKNTANEPGKEYRSTRAIASWNNLTQDRVRYICSVHKRIYLSTGPGDDLWSVYERGDRSIYEKRGAISV